MADSGPPPAQGLYDPALEHDSCGFGFVVDIKGRPSHDIVVKALEVLCNLEHRGATGAEKETGDGAGILLQTPHAFLAAACAKLGLTLPGPGRYGVGMVFLPPSEHGREAIYRLFDETIRNERQQLLGWRDVPTDNSTLGGSAKASLILEVYNLFNHHNYGSYNVNLSATAAATTALFGTPTQNLGNAYVPREAQLAFRLSF